MRTPWCGSRRRWACGAARTSATHRPLLAVDARGARLQRGQHAGDGGAYKTLATGGSASHRCRSNRWSAPTGRSCGERLPRRRRSSPTGRGRRRRHPAGRRAVRNGHRRQHRPSQIGKTGTDDNHDNAWFVGAVPQLAAAVWVGFHEGNPMEPPTRITVFGGTWPAQIWRLLMQRATTTLPAEPFPTPRFATSRWRSTRPSSRRACRAPTCPTTSRW